MPDSLRTVLERLDQWRHLPKYRLEQHVDVLFGMTLPRVLSLHLGVPEEDLCVIPEFPIRYGTLGKSEDRKASDNQSFNVDFSVWHKACQRVFLVEIKTDMDSLSTEQLAKMVEVQASGPFDRFVDGFVSIALATDEPRKYAQLIWRLHEVGAMHVPEGSTNGRRQTRPWGRERCLAMLLRDREVHIRTGLSARESRGSNGG